MKKLSFEEYSRYSAPMVLDLIAVFSIMEEEMSDLLLQADREGWTPDVLISKMEERL